MSQYKELKQKCFEANMQLPELNLVVYTFGNVSVADRDRSVFAIKPSGVLYKNLKADDIVIVDFENKVVEGKLRPSSDTKTHSFLYRSWKTVGGICHTHSTYAVAWAQAQKDIPILGTTHADSLTQDVPCTKPMSSQLIQGDYEHNTGQQIVDCFTERSLDFSEVEMVLVGSHGPFTWGKDADKAVYNSRILEELAKMAFLTLSINPDAPRLSDALIKKHFERKHGPDSYYGQE